MKRIYVVGTADTKGPELQYIGSLVGMVVSQAGKTSVPGEFGANFVVKVQPPMPPQSQVPRPSFESSQPTSSLRKMVLDVPSVIC